MTKQYITQIKTAWFRGFVSIVCLILSISIWPESLPVQAQNPDLAPWPMAGANSARTSWTPEEVTGDLEPLWFRPFEPYISQKVQIIAANNLLYISTASGLYALETGDEPGTMAGDIRWVYPTQLPLGHSPTIANGVAYVGGFDHKIHAIDALTGVGLWTYEAGAGFHTNPLVIEVNGKTMVYAGNRDGNFYAIEDKGSSSQLTWKYQTGGPILFSAAYKDGLIFFASNDSHAYALKLDGTLQWKSKKLPGAGFHSWWPVAYRDRVIFAGSNNYRTSIDPGSGEQFTEMELGDVYPNHWSDPRGTPVGPMGHELGDWVAGTETIDMSKPTITSNGSTTPVTEYFEEKPWRRTYFVLDQHSGQEIEYDFDNDGRKEYAPILWVGTHSGNRYPPVVGGDGVIYQSNNYMSDQWIAGGNITGWKMDTPFISVPSGVWNAVDEPQAYAAGGNLIYWNRCCDRMGAVINLTWPGDSNYLFVYNLADIIPGYNVRYYESNTDVTASFGGPNGVYGYHADTNPPIPYKGKLYMHRSNAIIAFGVTNDSHVALPMAETQNAPDPNISPMGANQLQSELASEIQKMLNAGHLRPGYNSHGIFDFFGREECGDHLVDYWHNSGETLYALIQTLPFLSPSLQTQVKTYLQNEFQNYSPHLYFHIGWSGAAREIFDVPPDANLDSQESPYPGSYSFENIGGWQKEGIWQRNPYGFYALWKYAEIFGNAQAILNEGRDELWLEFNDQPSDELLLTMPHIHNAYIAGYIGYLELEKLAGQAESSKIRHELDRLLQLRANNFRKDSAYAYSSDAYCRTLNVANNFMFMVPELADYLRQNTLTKVQEAMAEYEQIAPYWFVSFSEEGFAENAINPLYDGHSLFMAKALILEETGDELEKYLDVPAFERGDLFYIQKLVGILSSTSEPSDPTPTPEPTLEPTPTNEPTSEPTNEPTLEPTSEPTPQQPVSLIFDGPTSVELGEIFEMNVVAQNVLTPGLYGVQFEINYDPSLISVSELQVNPNLPFVVRNSADNAVGKVTLVASQEGKVSGLTDNVTLLSFQATAADTAGTVTFSFENEKFSDFQAQGFDITVKDYNVTIGQVTTPEPTQEPTSEPTNQPTPEPTTQPTSTPTLEPTPTSTSEPTSEPTPNPTSEPTPQPTSADLSGQIILAGRSDDNWSGATVTIDDKQSAITDKSGNFNISDLSPGLLASIKADAPGYLSAVCLDVTVVAPKTVLTPGTLLSGDINDDDLVDIVDATAVGASFGQIGQDLVADITLDEVVDIFDIVLVSVNFGEEGPQAWNCLNK